MVQSADTKVKEDMELENLDEQLREPDAKDQQEGAPIEQDTAEDIFSKHVKGWRLSMTEKGFNNAISAMQEYGAIQRRKAIQECIDFLNGYIKDKAIGDEEACGYIAAVGKLEKLL